ncbi:MAG: hypothetical protein IKJ73_00665 [Lachnospiraceae bacterium]|nr:hypothetical protein [Lachnospiraceae bacterium]
MKGDFTMEEMVKKKSIKKKILVVLGVLLIILVALFIWVWASLKHYMETNTWATIWITGTVEADTVDAIDESREFLKGDTYRLHSTKITIGDITHEGETKLYFDPAVVNVDTGETIGSVVIDKNKGINIKEVCTNGESASWQLRVTGNKYR